MWSAMVMAMMIATAGYYALAAQERVTINVSQGANLATDMATYRQMVINYASLPANRNVNDVRVPASALDQPFWLKPAVLAQWDNYIDGSGAIYVFVKADTPLPVNITADIVKLSRNSVLAGEAIVRNGSLVLRAPGDRDTSTGVPIDGHGSLLEAIDYGAHPALALPTQIPVGSPVWLASRN